MGGRRVGGRAAPSEGSEGTDKVAISAAETQWPAGGLLRATQRSARLCAVRAQHYCVEAGLHLLVERADVAREHRPRVAPGDVLGRVGAAPAALARAVDGLDERVRESLEV